MNPVAKHAFESDIGDLKQHYTRLFREWGDSPQTAQWSDRATQERRMEVLSEVGDLQGSKVLDFGCGTGHLFEFLKQRLKFKGEYVGYDISSEIISFAKNKYPGGRFETRDVLAQGLNEKFDYVLINGVFNNRILDNWNLLTTILKTVYVYATTAISFNLLSTYVDYSQPDLYYEKPERIFAFCKKELSPCVTLRHDYLVKPGIIPFEFTLYVFRTGLGATAASK
jgi:SAM-dependent methyltransferase